MVRHRSPEAPGRPTEGSGGPPGGPRTPPGPGSKNLKTHIFCRALLSSRVSKGQLRLVRVLTLAGLNEVFRHMLAHGVARTEGARLKCIWVYGWLQAAGKPFKKMGGAKPSIFLKAFPAARGKSRTSCLNLPPLPTL